MESWRKVFRDGLAPLLTTHDLNVLHMALAGDDPRLIQGATCSPPPLMCVAQWQVESACLVAYAGWIGQGLTTVAEVEEYFARICYEIDQRLGEPAGCRWFLNWFDEEPRDVMLKSLLPEIELEIQKRAFQAAQGAS